MVLLVCFDLSRETKDDRKLANQYRERLLDLGFSMKQFSLYERVVSNSRKRDKVIEILQHELPHTGRITLYTLPDEVNSNQITILGHEEQPIKYTEPRLIFI